MTNEQKHNISFFRQKAHLYLPPLQKQHIKT